MAVQLTRFRLAILFYGVLAPVGLVGFAALISESVAGFQGMVLIGGGIAIAGLGFLLTSRSDVRTLVTAWEQRDQDSEPPAALREAVSLTSLGLLCWGGLLLSVLL